jgi:predicted MFS family arabinose efflux permease
MIVGTIFMSLGMFSYLFVGGAQPWAIVIPALLTGAGHGLMFHTMTSLTVAKFPHEVQGTGSVWALMMLDLGTIAGAPALGVIGQHYGFHAMFAAVGVTCLLAGLCYAITTRGVASFTKRLHWIRT